MDFEFRNIVETLPTARDDEKIVTLKQISEKLGISLVSLKKASGGNIISTTLASSLFLQSTIESSSLVKVLASVMEESGYWANDLPSWIKDLLIRIYYRMQCKIPYDQTEYLVKICLKYLNSVISASVIIVLSCIATPHENRAPMAVDPMYNIIKKAIFIPEKGITSHALRFLQVATENCVEWQKKILEDSLTVRDLLTLPPSDDVWSLFGNLSHHPDAKTLFPPEVLEKASQNKNFDSCNDICAILSTETGATQLTLDKVYIETRAQYLKKLLDEQMNMINTRYTLLDLILPLVNLSVADVNKEILGDLFIDSLLHVLQIKHSNSLIPEISRCLDRSQQEASKTLWNLAFNENNRKRILDNGGMKVLRPFIKQTSVQQNINGVLYMLTEHNKHQPHESTSKGHIMISYNWANQPIVQKIAQSLKDKGYVIWLDTEQMRGSTLEAMAEAVEQSELVLMCMSQRYKDSPNCRLEGEYIQTRQNCFIPVMMQQDYKPDGWLGILLGAKLYHSFTDEQDWDQKIAKLAYEIGNRGRGTTKRKLSIITSTARASSSSSLVPASPCSVVPKDWDEEGLFEWMKSEGIEQHHDAFSRHKIDGKALLEFGMLLTSSSPLVASLFALLNITEVGEILKICSAIRKLNTMK